MAYECILTEVEDGVGCIVFIGAREKAFTAGGHPWAAVGRLALYARTAAG